MNFNKAIKKSGEWGEVACYKALKKAFPQALLFRHVALDYSKATGEIPFVLVNDGKIFLIGYNTWSGIIYEEQGEIYQERVTHAGDKRTTKMESPYKQLERDLFLVKGLVGDLNFENIFVFLGCDNLTVEENVPSFMSTKDMIKYIKSSTLKANNQKDIDSFVKKINCYDVICGFKTFIPCVINPGCLTFGGKLEKEVLSELSIKHKEDSDIVKVSGKDGLKIDINTTGHKISYLYNGEKGSVNLSSISFVKIA